MPFADSNAATWSLNLNVRKTDLHLMQFVPTLLGRTGLVLSSPPNSVLGSPLLPCRMCICQRAVALRTYGFWVFFCKFRDLIGKICCTFDGRFWQGFRSPTPRSYLRCQSRLCFLWVRKVLVWPKPLVPLALSSATSDCPLSCRWRTSDDETWKRRPLFSHVLHLTNQTQK